MDIRKMQAQDELTKEQEALFYGQVIKAVKDITKKQRGKKPERMKVHPKLYQQIVPFITRIKGGPVRCFSIPVEPEIGVPYGEFIFESTTNGIIKGH